MQVGIPYGAQPVTISGAEFWPLQLDEATVLTGYRLIRDQGNGSMAIEFRNLQVTRWDVAPNVGSVKTLNAAIAQRQRLRE